MYIYIYIHREWAYASFFSPSLIIRALVLYPHIYYYIHTHKHTHTGIYRV
jgi:hypothetical protein